MNKYTYELNKYLLQLLGESYPIGLAQGKMGICIYFYHLSRIEQKEKYNTKADKLLEDILKKLSIDSPINVENGLAGIALGLIYLIKKGFVEGEINELLEDIDNVIFKRLVFLQDNTSYSKNELLYVLFYLSFRLSNQSNECDRYILQELIIKTLNNFVSGLSGEFFGETYSFSICNYHTPLFAFICARLLEQGFYNERIYRILEEFELTILSRFPLLHANRLYLLCGILPLVPYMHNSQWKDYTDLLHREISLPVIFGREMKNKQIFLSNGLSMIYLFLYYLGENYPTYKIVYNPQDFYDKIIASNAWDSILKKKNFFSIYGGLLDGFPGVELVLSHIQKQNV